MALEVVLLSTELDLRLSEIPRAASDHFPAYFSEAVNLFHAPTGSVNITLRRSVVSRTMMPTSVEATSMQSPPLASE
jgi:hypothetical protein